jgi:hypothetical protein
VPKSPQDPHKDWCLQTRPCAARSVGGWLNQALLTELARARAHGFSARELAAAVKLEMADVESLYVERDQIYAQVPNRHVSLTHCMWETQDVKLVLAVLGFPSARLHGRHCTQQDSCA